MVNLILKNKKIGMDDVINITTSNDVMITQINDKVGKIIDTYNAMVADVNQAISDLRDLQNIVEARDENASLDTDDTINYNIILDTLATRLHDLQINSRHDNGSLIIPTHGGTEKKTNKIPVLIRRPDYTWAPKVTVAQFDNCKFVFDSPIDESDSVIAGVKTLKIQIGELSDNAFDNVAGNFTPFVSDIGTLYNRDTYNTVPAIVSNPTNQHVSDMIDTCISKLEDLEHYLQMNVIRGNSGQRMLQTYSNVMEL